MIEPAVQPTPSRLRRQSFLTAPRGVAVLLATAVVVVRVVLSRRLSFCGTPDACYYLGMAQNLAAGRGFHARFLYDFQQAHPTLPNTGIEYWRPGISLLLLVLEPLGGVTLHASIVLTTLVGVLFSAAAWHMAMRTYADRRIALGSFAFCLLSSPVWVGSTTPDSGLYYGAAVAWFLALLTVRRQGWLQDLFALVCAGLAYGIRNDAAMLLVPLLTVLWMRQKEAGRSRGYAALMIVGFFAVLAPMHLLYHAVLGTAFPSGTARVLYLNDLSDFGRYHDPATLHSLLAHGMGHLVVFRLTTLLTVLYRIAVLMIGYPALVFLPGLFVSGVGSLQAAGSRRFPEVTGPLSFGLTALFAYTLVLPAIGGFSALRTAVGLLPLASVLTVVAIRRVCRDNRVAAWVTAAVVAASALAGAMEMRRDLPMANGIGAADRAEAERLAALGADPASAVVLTNDPVQFSVTTGYATIALPSNGLDAIAQAARDFRATHVILDSDNLPGTPADLMRQLHPLRSVTLPREHSLVLELPPDGAAP